jgi:hypothetical protein
LPHRSLRGDIKISGHELMETAPMAGTIRVLPPEIEKPSRRAALALGPPGYGAAIAQNRHVIEGVITTGDVLTHAGLIWREFGPRCLFRCARALFRTRPTTFLQVAVQLE